MSLKYKIASALVILAATFTAGRYSVSGKTKTKTTDTTKTVDKTEHKKIVIYKKPNGETVTTITDDTNTKTEKTKQVIDIKTTESRHNILNVSALVANDFRDTFKPVYGVSVSKEILGPVTVGAFGLTNGVVGVSLGLNF